MNGCVEIQKWFIGIYSAYNWVDPISSITPSSWTVQLPSQFLVPRHREKETWPPSWIDVHAKLWLASTWEEVISEFPRNICEDVLRHNGPLRLVWNLIELCWPEAFSVRLANALNIRKNNWSQFDRDDWHMTWNIIDKSRKSEKFARWKILSKLYQWDELDKQTVRVMGRLFVKILGLARVSDHQPSMATISTSIIQTR